MLSEDISEPLTNDSPATSRYRLVKLPSGACSVHSLDYRETFHPVVGPVAEAEALYVRQLRLPERFARTREQFIIWDIGLGSAGNVLTVFRALRSIPGELRMLSFDHTLAPLEFALQHQEELGYLAGYEQFVGDLLRRSSTTFGLGEHHVQWEFHGGDFPRLLESPAISQLPAPHAILFDAFSPATNPEMWTQPLFAKLHSMLDPRRPCALPTYSRSTMLRATLLLAGFYVGRGHATGQKEETTIAANELALLEHPLDSRWLERARRSSSAEPMWEPAYRQAPLSPKSWELLQKHPQFSNCHA